MRERGLNYLLKNDNDILFSLLQTWCWCTARILAMNQFSLGRAMFYVA